MDGLHWTMADCNRLWQTTPDYAELLDHDGLQWTTTDQDGQDGLIVDTHLRIWSER